jgi:hypothetical protein
MADLHAILCLRCMCEPCVANALQFMKVAATVHDVTDEACDIKYEVHQLLLLAAHCSSSPTPAVKVTGHHCLYAPDAGGAVASRLMHIRYSD